MENRPVFSADVFRTEALADPAAYAMIENVIRLISIKLGRGVNTLNLDIIVMGSGVVHANQVFFPRIHRRIRNFVMTEEVGVVGDLCNRFFTAEMALIDDTIYAQIIGIQPEILREAKHVLAVACMPEKALATAACCPAE